MELIDLSSLACPGCHEPVDDGNEGFVHLDGSPLCRGETDPVEIEHDDERAARHVRTMADEGALDAIAYILRDPSGLTGCSKTLPRSS